MRRAAGLGAIFGSLALNGCAVHPLPEDVTRSSTYDIVQSIRCEAKQAIMQHAPGTSFDRAVIGYEFLFKITEHNDNSGGATFKYPFTNGMFTLAMGAGVDKTRVSDRNFRIVETFRDLKKMTCPGDLPRRNLKYPISGAIGLYEVVETYLRLEGATDLAPVEASKTDIPVFADTLSFTTKINAGVNPSVSITPVMKRFRLAEGGVNLQADRTDLHQVTLAMSIDRKTQRRMSSGGAISRTFAITPLSTAPVQTDGNARERVLQELDRQRILEQNLRLFGVLGVTQ